MENEKSIIIKEIQDLEFKSNNSCFSKEWLNMFEMDTLLKMKKEMEMILKEKNTTGAI